MLFAYYFLIPSHNCSFESKSLPPKGGRVEGQIKDSKKRLRDQKRMPPAMLEPVVN